MKWKWNKCGWEGNNLKMNIKISSILKSLIRKIEDLGFSAKIYFKIFFVRVFWVFFSSQWAFFPAFKILNLYDFNYNVCFNDLKVQFNSWSFNHTWLFTVLSK